MINLSLIKERLFSDKKTLALIAKDYKLESSFQNSDDFGRAIIRALNQQVSVDPLNAHVGNENIFRAAVWSIGSSARKWSVFLKKEEVLKDLLVGYDPEKAHERFRYEPRLLEKVIHCLPGQSQGNDARAIEKWAALLSRQENYYSFIGRLGTAFRKLAKEMTVVSMTDAELMICLAGYLSDPPLNWPGEKFLEDDIGHFPDMGRKLPGMRYPLACEFLRNLKWNGFKPDRHIKRLFDLWFPRFKEKMSDRVSRIEQMIGRKNKILHDDLCYSFLGLEVSPPGIPLSEVDNFIWLLGNYVEKKGKESNRQYVTTMIA